MTEITESVDKTGLPDAGARRSPLARPHLKWAADQDSKIILRFVYTNNWCATKRAPNFKGTEGRCLFRALGDGQVLGVTPTKVDQIESISLSRQKSAPYLQALAAPASPNRKNRSRIREASYIPIARACGDELRAFRPFSKDRPATSRPFSS